MADHSYDPKRFIRLKKRVAIPEEKSESTSKELLSSTFKESRVLNLSGVYFDNKPSPEVLLTHFKEEGRLEESVALQIIKDAEEIFRKEDTLLELEGPLRICGDIHGQFFDLITLFTVGGMPPEKRYLFLGDYVDRGCFGVECILYLWALKVNYPDSIYLLRGNHECRGVTAYFRFKHECEVKYSLNFYNACMNSFDALPLAALVDYEYFCVHGGLSPQIRFIDDIRKINRFQEPPHEGPMCDLLWSDPLPDYNTNNTKDHFFFNTLRGCSYFFSYAACAAFLRRSRLSTMIRAHEIKKEGYEIYRKLGESAQPSLITIFSAPNYLDVHENKAAMLKCNGKVLKIKQFSATPHPFWLVGLTDAIAYTMPFVCEQALKGVFSILENTEDTLSTSTSNIKLNYVSTASAELESASNSFIDSE